MKKFLLFTFLVLASVISMQAQKVSLDFTTNSWGFPEGSSNKAVNAATFTSNGYSIVMTGTSDAGYYFNTTQNYLIFGKNGSTLQLPAFDFNVSKIEVIGRAGASANTLENIYVGTTAVSTQCKGATGTNTFEIAADYQAAGNIYVLKVESKHNAQVTTINIYEAGADEGGNEGEEGGNETPEVTTSTIADAIATGAGNAKVSGTIVATYARGFLVSDATGSILVYLGSDNGHVVGDVVTVEGTTSTYAGMLQFGAGTTVEKTGTATVAQPTPAVMSATDMDAYLNAPVIKYVEYTGTLTISDNYYNVAIEGAATAIGSISYPKEGVVNAASGDKVKVTGYTIGVSSSKYVNTMAVSVVKVDDSGTTEPEEPTNEVYIEESFATEFGDFTQQQTVGTYEWVIDYSTAKMTSYSNGVNNASESWLISPSVDFTEETQAYISFEYVIMYADAATLTENHKLYISKDYAGDVATATWTAIDFNATASSSFSDFKQVSLNIPAEFMGESELTFAFRYIGTETKAGTWEIRNLIVAHGEAETVTPEPEPEPETFKCNVTEAIAAYVDGETKPAVVTGYIVGAFNSNYVAEFGSTVTIATNILISDNADESDVANCLIVQLPKGDIRTALNLLETPDNYKKQVILTGSIEKYFQTAGLKSVTNYEFTGITGIEDVIGETNETVKVIYDLTGRRIDNITKAGIYIVNGKKVLIK